MNLNWEALWMSLFGTTEWLGLNMGFWVSMAVVTLIVVLMNVVFWSIRPKKQDSYANNNKKSLKEKKEY